MSATLQEAANAARATTTGRSAPSASRNVIHLADVQAERITWLWRGRLAFGKLHILDGNPGLGKSLITIDWAARLTTGQPMPGEEFALAPPASVLFVAGEDGLGDTVRPRLEAAGADLTRCHAMPVIALEDGGERAFALPDDVGTLELAVREHGVRLVVIDPLTAHLAEGLNAYRDQDIRRAFLPLQQMADRTGVTVVIVRHLTKASGASALMRGGGSIAIVAAARVGLIVGEDPEDPDQRVLAVTKANIAKRAPSLAYRVSLPPSEDDSPGVEWLEQSELTADQLVAPPGEAEGSSLTEAAEWLEAYLAGGAKPSRTVEKEGQRDGFSRATLRRAKGQLGVTASKEGFGAGGQWVWRLPAGADPKVLNEDLRRPTPTGEHLSESVSILGNDGPVAADAAESVQAETVTVCASPKGATGATCDGCGISLPPLTAGDLCSVCAPRVARAKRPAA